MAEIEATVNNLQTQLTAVQAAIEGNSQISMFKPRPFSGALHEDVNEWTAKFDRFAKFYNWGNAKKLGAMVLLFEGPALSWFQTLPEETTNNFPSLVDALKTRFGATNIDFILRQELYARKQGPVEPLACYTEDIIKRCQRLSISENELMNIFINGLNSELKSHVILNQPKSFSEAENLARLRDAVSKSSGVNSLPVTGPTVQDQRIKQLEGQVNLLLSLTSERQHSTQQSVHAISPGLIPQAPPICHELSELQQVKTELIAALQDVKRNQVPQRQGQAYQNVRSPGDPRGRNLRTTDGQPVCNFCQRIGHVARYCDERHNQNNQHQPRFQQRSQVPYRFASNMQTRFRPTVGGNSQSSFQRNQGREFYYPQQQNLNGEGPSQWGN